MFHHVSSEHKFRKYLPCPLQLLKYQMGMCIKSADQMHSFYIQR